MGCCSKLIDAADLFLSYETEQKHTWCSGCGNYWILNALMRAVALEWINRHEMILVNDVGCNGNVSDKILTNTIHGLHGRSLALASGVHLANHTIPVIVTAGDGATMSEWINHFIHTARNNFNITFILHNNFNYWLTTWQASATTPKWTAMKWTVWEVVTETIIPIKVWLAAGATFVARWYSGNVDQLTELIRAWIHHQWFSMIEVFQLCPTYSKATPWSRYENRVYEVDASHDTTDPYATMKLAENFDRLATGVLYQKSDQEDYYSLQPQRKEKTTRLIDEVEHLNVEGLMEQFIV